jgi:hypothetical protein
MKRLLDRWLFELERLGWAGGLGVACLVAALAFDRAMLTPLEHERAELEARNERVERVLADRRATEGRTQAERATASVTTEEALRRLFAAAGAAGVNLKQGDYILGAEADADQRRYRISLPVTGDYPALRVFIARALNDNPALALTQVDITRPVIEDSQVKAGLRFTLFLGGGQ